MKRLITISLFIFGIVVVLVLVSGFISYQNDNRVAKVDTNNITITNTLPSGTILNMSEIEKHNTQSDCWMLISGKVYNITSYFGKHPGGSVTMSLTCGKDATAAYSTQDPYASSVSSRSAHSSRAKSLLDSYYIGDLNEL